MLFALPKYQRRLTHLERQGDLVAGAKVRYCVLNDDKLSFADCFDASFVDLLDVELFVASVHVFFGLSKPVAGKNMAAIY